MLNVGYDVPEHLSEEEISAKTTLEVGAILHKDHSYCQVLGHAFELGTPTLFAPAFVVSRGCSVGGIDLLNVDQRSIVDHMLGLKENVIVGHKIPAGTGMKKFRDLLVGSVDDLNRMTNKEEEIVEEKTEG